MGKNVYYDNVYLSYDVASGSNVLIHIGIKGEAGAVKHIEALQ